MKLGGQIFVMCVIAFIMHIILSGQVVFLGSLYRFNSNKASSGTGDLIYLQDKKIVTQKIVEYTKITNLQNDITETLENSKAAFVYLFTGGNATGNDLYLLLQKSDKRGIILSNDGVILLPYDNINQSDNWYIATNYGTIYKIIDVFPMKEKQISLARVSVEKNQDLLPKIIEVMSYRSPILLGQLFLQPQWSVDSNAFAICMVSLLQKNIFSDCSQIVGKMSDGFLISTYGELVGIAKNNRITLITKEQVQKWIDFLALHTTGTFIPEQEYFSGLTIINSLSRGVYNIGQNQGRIINSLSSLSPDFGLLTGDIIKEINGIGPIIGRSYSDLLDGIASGTKIQFEK